MALKNRSTPSTYITEIDQSNVIQPTGTSTGAIVIKSKKGPIARPVLVTNDKEFIETFGYPEFTSGTSNADPLTPEMGYGAIASLIFLQESNSLYVVRDFTTNVSGGDKFASCLFNVDGTTTNTSATGIDAVADVIADKVDSIYAINQFPMTGKAILFGATSPGLDGNNTAVTVQTFSSACDWFNSYYLYSSAAGGATDITNHPIASQVFKVSVYRKADSESWSTLTFANYSASPVETFYGTRVAMQDSNKRQLLISEIINGVSKYIYVVPGTANFTSAISLTATPTAVNALSAGGFKYDDGIADTTGWSYFNNKEDVSPKILICPDYTTTVKQTVANIAAARQDCIAVGQVGARTVTTFASISTNELYGYNNPSYMAVYAGWSQIYDTYNDKKVYVPNAIFGAALMARTDRVANTWDAPAGPNRGVFSCISQNIQLSFGQIGQLYDKNINSVRWMPNRGFIMWGQKTAQLKKSALDRVNVRRLLIYIENSIEPSLVDFLFEPNTDGTRLRVSNIVDSFLATVQSGGGLTAYSVVCDTSNNTPVVIDNNTMILDIALQPTKTVEVIEMQITIQRTGATFAVNA